MVLCLTDDEAARLKTLVAKGLRSLRYDVGEFVSNIGLPTFVRHQAEEELSEFEILSEKIQRGE